MMLRKIALATMMTLVAMTANAVELTNDTAISSDRLFDGLTAAGIKFVGTGESADVAYVFIGTGGSDAPADICDVAKQYTDLPVTIFIYGNGGTSVDCK